MNISPLDIRKHEFRKTMRGYDPEEVSAFLELVSNEFETMVRENSQFKERFNNLDSQLKKYRDIESTLRETLLSAQRAREDTVNTAKKQADVIIREAEVKAASIIENGRRDLDTIRRTFNELRVQKDNYVVKLKTVIRGQLEMIEKLERGEEKELARIEAAADERDAQAAERTANAVVSLDNDRGKTADADE